MNCAARPTILAPGFVVLVISSAAMLAACSGNSTGSATAADTAATQAQALRIQGTPPTSVVAGQAYDFSPQVTASPGASLGYSIDHKPAWATFSSSTGRLSGQPAAADVGTYAAIVISVADARSSAALAPFALSVREPAPPLTAAATATLSWQAPAVNSDGTPLTDLQGYRIYIGTDPAALTRVIEVAASEQSYTVDALAPGTYYFALRAYNTASVESVLSEIVSKTL
jgi:hypothetical protein